MPLLRALAVAWLMAAAPALAGTPTEYQVKAVFLFNFSQFVEWPAQAFNAADAPFTLCIVGEDHFGVQLDAAVRGESVQGHPLVVKRYHDLTEISSCHMLFISDSEVPQLDQILGSLGGRATLTVSDIDHSAERGAIIQFTNENNRLRLRINVAAARAAGLTISSKLLRPAEIIGAGRG
jgi:YfiR/HmsC-like